MRSLALSLTLSFSMLFPALSAAEETVTIDADTSSHTQGQKVSVPGDVRGDGAFRYSVPFKIPAFRGLEPKLGLAYRSHVKLGGGSRQTVSQGWSLSGLSVIERRSAGGGVPSYDNTQDIFVLDGMELMACADGNATAPWQYGYPARYKTDQKSASCLAGGQFSTQLESYRKITRTGAPGTANSEFTVWRPDGTQYVYRSIGELAGVSASATGDDFKVAFQRKWLLSEIRDAQATPNVVAFSYAFEVKEKAYSHRPTLIEYAGYRVQLHNTADHSQARKVATGTGYFEDNPRMLQSVSVWDGSQPIRAYALTYTDSPALGLRRLSSVQEYGSDFTISGGVVQGGSTLPPVTFDYTSDAYQLQEVKLDWHLGYNSTKEINDRVNNARSVDVNSDGRSDLVSIPLVTYRHCQHDGCDVKYEPRPKTEGQVLLGQQNRSLSAGPAEKLPIFATNSTLHSDDLPTDSVILGDGDGPVFIEEGSEGKFVYLSCRKFKASGGGPDPIYYDHDCTFSAREIQADGSKNFHTEVFDSRPSLSRVEVGLFGPRSDPSLAWGNATSIIGIFDIGSDGSIGDYQETPGLRVGNFGDSSSSSSLKSLLSADLDGNGVNELIAAKGYYENRDGIWTGTALSGTHFGYKGGAASGYNFSIPRTVVFGDINGDGAEDAVLIVRYDGDMRVEVALSTGKGFNAWDRSWDDDFDSRAELSFGWKQNLGSGEIPAYSVTDVNGDGLSDLILNERKGGCSCLTGQSLSTTRRAALIS